MTALYGREPVLVLAVVQAALALAMGFGAHLTGDQMALVMTFTGALLGLLTRTQVTPMATLPDHVAAAVVNASNAAIPKLPLLPPGPV